MATMQDNLQHAQVEGLTKLLVLLTVEPWHLFLWFLGMAGISLIYGYFIFIYFILFIQNTGKFDNLKCIKICFQLKISANKNFRWKHSSRMWTTYFVGQYKM